MANVVVHTDLNCLSVLQYAVDVLRVRARHRLRPLWLRGRACRVLRSSLGLIDNWLRHIQDVRERHEARLDAAADEEACINRLCELNVIDQVRNVCQTTIVQEAWTRGQPSTIHGWIYDVRTDSCATCTSPSRLPTRVAAAYAQAVEWRPSDASTPR